MAEFNESKSLGMMIYSHFVFSILRFIVSVVFEDDVYTNSLASSYLLSLDLIVAVTIYLLPKMLMPADTIRQVQRRRSTHLSSTTKELEDEVKRRPSLRSMSQSLNMIEEHKDDEELEKSTSSSREESIESTDCKESFLLDGCMANQNHASNAETHSEVSCEDDPRSSVHYWAKAPDAPKPISRSSPGPRRVKFMTDVDNDELKAKLVKKDQELIELKDAIRDLQQSRYQ
ncbi:MAG: hypothetical protein SGBAC_011194 [Bacillariaceae sp.]